MSTTKSEFKNGLLKTVGLSEGARTALTAAVEEDSIGFAILPADTPRIIIDRMHESKLRGVVLDDTDWVALAGALPNTDASRNILNISHIPGLSTRPMLIVNADEAVDSLEADRTAQEDAAHISDTESDAEQAKQLDAQIMRDEAFKR